MAKAKTFLPAKTISKPFVSFPDETKVDFGNENSRQELLHRFHLKRAQHMKVTQILRRKRP